MKPKPSTLNVLLADDDADDRFFFDKALKELATPTILVTVPDGEKLMVHLSKNAKKLPDVLFLDLNMPRKNGMECLTEIKEDEKLKELPVIIYSTSLHEDMASQLYNKGAHYYIRKSDFYELKRVLAKIVDLMKSKKIVRPSRAGFVISPEA